MAKVLYASISGFSNIISVIVNHSHGASTSTAVITAVNCSKGIGDLISINLGYQTSHSKVFEGYVKMIERKVPENVYIVTCSDVMIRAVDYWLVSCNPEQPFTRSNIAVEDLVRDVLAEAGLTNYGSQSTYFIFATGEEPAEVNLVSAYDYCSGLADLVTFHLYADVNGKCWFVNRKPFPMDGTSGQVGDHNDVPIGSIGDSDTIAFAYRRHERDLRNRVVVYGAEGIYACRQVASPYLPSGFFKTAVLSSHIIATQSLAEDIADYNLHLWNRLTYEISAVVEGDSSLIARNTIRVTNSATGISNEEFYIYTSEHRWSADGYTVSLELRA